MGYAALPRNLRNFDQAGLSDEVAAQVAATLAAPEQVARASCRCGSTRRTTRPRRCAGDTALERAPYAPPSGVPALDGRTLVMVDTSSSMDAGFSRDGTLTRWDVAAVFSIAPSRRCVCGPTWCRSPAPATTSTTPPAAHEAARTDGRRSTAAGRAAMEGRRLVPRRRHRHRGGTAAAPRKEFDGHDRLVVITDEQTGHDVREVTDSIPATIAMYTPNLAGHQPAGTPCRVAGTGTRSAGWAAAFRTVRLLEARRDAYWPGETTG